MAAALPADGDAEPPDPHGNLRIGGPKDGGGMVRHLASSEPPVVSKRMADYGRLIVSEWPPARLSSVGVTFYDPDSAGPFTAMVDWGDGSPEEDASISCCDTNGHYTVDATHAFADNSVNYGSDPIEWSTYTTTVTVADESGNEGSVTFAVLVANLPPTIEARLDNGVVPVNDEYEFKVLAKDGGTADTHTAEVAWGDGSPVESAIVAESPFGPPGSVDGHSFTVVASHTYVQVGTYTVQVTVADDDGGQVTGSFEVEVTCALNSECDDGLFCNGAEICTAGVGCQPGTPPNCEDGIPCTDDTCNEATDSCDHTPIDSRCDDGLFCNGDEFCDAATGCKTGVAPCDDSNVCLEESDKCTPKFCGTNNDKVFVCHQTKKNLRNLKEKMFVGKPQGKKETRTLCIDSDSLTDHLDHGDHAGACLT